MSLFGGFSNMNQFDPDAGAFINATKIGGIQAEAINNLVQQLKAAGFNTTQLKTAGFDAIQLKNTGIKAIQLKTVKFKLRELKKMLNLQK